MDQAIERRNQLVAAAVAAQKSGYSDAARQNAEAALRLDPKCVPAMFLLGVIHARKGEHSQAEAMLSQVLAADPHAYEALISLSTIYREVGKFSEALSLGARAVQVRPNEAVAHNNMGRCLLAARKLDDACRAFAHATTLNPDFAAAYFNLGKSKQLEGKDGEAARCFSQAAAISPTADHLLALGQVLLALCDFDSALECAQRCVAMFPQSAAAHLLLCGVLIERSDVVAAEEHLKEAVQLDPEGREAEQTAVRQRPLGHIAEANENLRRAIRQKPAQISAYDALIQNHRVNEQDRDIVERLERMLGEGNLSPTERVSAHYGLGKAFEDLQEYGESMRHYDEANRITRYLKFGETRFDESQYSQYVDGLINRLTGTGPINDADESDLPVLVVGMMRSGTSLVEQILTGHSQIVGAGEQLFWSRNWSRALHPDTKSLVPEQVCQLGREYRDMLNSFDSAAMRVTDKMPGNCMFTGLIHLALPKARFIHIRRNPVDTCLSIWATPNHMPHEGGNDKGNIVFTYKQYLRLMDHWRRAVPADRLLEVDYESLVSEPETVIPQMISFCGVEWDEACLRPQDNKRLVLTPSAWQVRQPLHKKSVARWKRFEPWLGDFRELLDPK